MRVIHTYHSLNYNALTCFISPRLLYYIDKGILMFILVIVEGDIRRWNIGIFVGVYYYITRGRGAKGKRKSEHPPRPFLLFIYRFLFNIILILGQIINCVRIDSHYIMFLGKGDWYIIPDKRSYYHAIICMLFVGLTSWYTQGKHRETNNN